MIKKISALLICLLLLSATGCGKNEDTLSVDKPESSAPQVTETVNLEVNPLTGLKDTSAEKLGDRPVAVTVNNIKTAQPVQTGLNKADIIYETEVEGGITRLLALYQNPEKAGRIGTVRSARYVFIDLAMGHNAIYIHHGMDYFHALKHLNDVDRMELTVNNGGKRVSNGLATEHTLYADGEKMWNNIKKKGINTKAASNAAWQSFADESESLTLGNSASSVTVPFNSNVKSTFTYDASTGRYTRSFNGTVRKDYVTGEAVTIKNVFVLYTTIRNYSCTGEDTYGHREVLLNSGDGYYCVNGTYTPIKWSKGAASSSVKFTNTDGSELKVNAGNSWVCIADKNKSQAVFG